MTAVAERKQKAKAERVAAAEESDRETLIERLKGLLQEKYQIKFEPFASSRKTILPPYCLTMNGKIIGFSDVLIGKREEYVKISAATYRNGAFCVEHFGVPKDATLKKLSRMRYVVFLLDWDSTYRWSYNPGKIKPYPTLTEQDGLKVYISKREFEPV